MRARTAIVAAVALVLSAAPATQNVGIFKVSTPGQVAVYRPASIRSQGVLFICGDGGWNLGVVWTTVTTAVANLVLITS